VKHSAAVVAGLLALIVPTFSNATAPETEPNIKVSTSLDVAKSIYVHTETMVLVGLPVGEKLNVKAMIADSRWRLERIPDSGGREWVVVKPTSGDLSMPQQLIMPGERHMMRLMLSAGKGESTAYSVLFVDPDANKPKVTYRPAPSVLPANYRQPAPVATRAPQPKSLAITDCGTQGDSAYSWKGDSSIDVRQTCTDKGFHHTFIVMQRGRIPDGAVVYKVDPGGKEDKYPNCTFVQAMGSYPDQWVCDGVADHWALVVDSSAGHRRKDVARK
jgi:hypothetical protein